MSFEEAFELSYFGAKVLHPSTMLPLLEKKIPVQILNSKRELSSGTLVEVDSLTLGSVVKSIAHRKNLSIITISPHRRYGQYAFWEGVFSVLTRHDISSALITSSEYNLSLLIDDRFITDGLLHGLNDFGSTRVFGGRGCITIIGKGMRESSGILSAIFKSLGDEAIQMVSYGASDSSISIVLDADHITTVLKKLHREFFEDARVSEIFEPVRA